QTRSIDKIFQRRRISSRAFGTFAGEQIEFSQLLAFVSRGDQGRAAVELMDDLEDILLPVLRGAPPQQLPTDSQVERRASFIRGQRVGGFLHSVVDKPVGSRLVLDQFL